MMTRDVDKKRKMTIQIHRLLLVAVDLKKRDFQVP